MTPVAIFDCPACGAAIPADRPIWRCSCGSHLNLAPGPGLGRREIDVRQLALGLAEQGRDLVATVGRLDDGRVTAPGGGRYFGFVGLG